MKRNDYEQKEHLKQQILEAMILPTLQYKTPFLILLTGYSGSGKSTVASYLSHKLNLYIVSGDKIRNMIYGNQNYPQDFETIEIITNEMVELEIEKCLTNQISVVLDRSISSLKVLKQMQQQYKNLFLIKLESDHERNKKRICEKGKYIPPTPIYGDWDSSLGLCKKTIKEYDIILKRKIYDIPNEMYDTILDSNCDIESLFSQLDQVMEKIKIKFQ